jgi:hypothetical protein
MSRDACWRSAVSLRSGAGFFNRPRLHFTRNVLAHAGKRGGAASRPSSATAFAQEDAARGDGAVRLADASPSSRTTRGRSSAPTT